MCIELAEGLKSFYVYDKHVLGNRSSSLCGADAVVWE